MAKARYLQFFNPDGSKTLVAMCDDLAEYRKPRRGAVEELSQRFIKANNITDLETLINTVRENLEPGEEFDLLPEDFRPPEGIVQAFEVVPLEFVCAKLLRRQFRKRRSEFSISGIEHAVFVEAMIARKLIALGGIREDTSLLYDEEVAEAVARVILGWKFRVGGE